MDIKQFVEQNIWPDITSDSEKKTDLVFASENKYQFTETYKYEPVSLFLWSKKHDQRNNFFYSGLFNHQTFMWTSDLQEYNGIIIRAHDNIHLIYVAEGYAKSNIESKDIYLTKGDLLLINGSVPHREFLPKDDCILVLLDINMLFFKSSTMGESEEFKSLINEWITSHRSQYMCYQLTPKTKDSLVPNYYLNILSEMYYNRPGRNDFIIGSTKRILSLCSTDYYSFLSFNDTSAFRDALVADIENYIVACYPTVSVKEIGAVFHYSPDYLGRIFLNNRGTTISAFIQDIRIKAAFKMLRTTNMPISSISEKVGYRNQGFFYKKFKEKYNMTPNEARNY